MSTSRWAAVVDSVIATLAESPDLVGVHIYDGPNITSDSPPDSITVGHSGANEEDVAGSLTQEYRNTGVMAPRDETCEVRCVAQSIDGGTNLAVVRHRALALLGVVESTLRANPQLGLAGIQRVEVSTGTVRQAQTGQGCGVRIEFTIRAFGLI